MDAGRAGNRLRGTYPHRQEMTVRMTPRRLLGALFATSLLFGVACGDDDDAGPVGETEADGTTGDPAGQAPGLPPGENDVTDDPSVADTAPQGAPEGAPAPDDGGGQ
jgi:hypothetical protein